MPKRQTTKCRVCNRLAIEIADFGSMPIANDFNSEKSKDLYRFNLAAAYCENCFLIQLIDQPKPELMFHDHYTFFTGLSSYMSTHFREMALSNLPSELPADYMVTEIGCNDGTLLKSIAELGVKHLGVDPSENVVNYARAQGVTAEVAFFSEDTVEKLLRKYSKSDLILAANVICHIPDLNDLASGIKKFLKENGKFVFEEPYVGSMIEKTSYDQLYDEHVYIFGAHSVQRIFKRHGLELTACEPQQTHGGSMRYTICHDGKGEIQASVGKTLREEEFLGLNNVKAYQTFGKMCEIRKKELVSLLQSLKSNDKTVAGYAATSKSTTVLNYCGIDASLISYISDSTKEKIGTYAPGSHIPIVSHEQMRLNPPDYLVLFAWNHEKEIMEKESGILDPRTKWIRFVPKVEVIS